MSIYKSLAAELEHYGERITITSEAGESVIKGILQPLLYKNKMYISGSQLPSGFFDSGHYLLICPPDAELPVLGAVFLEAQGKRFILKRSEKVKSKSQVFYVWAVLCPYEEPVKEDSDGI